MTAIAAYEAGLLGMADCWLHHDDGPPQPVPLDRWLAGAGLHDEALLRTVWPGPSRGPRGGPVCGPVLDVGCGPGRLTAALAERGADALGIDVSPVAVALARARGAKALRRNVFRTLPAEGGWGVVLLADGNIGIGGDPVRLLRRCRDLLACGGEVVADVQDGGGVRRRRQWLSAHHPGGGQMGGPLDWAAVGIDAVPALGHSAGIVAGPAHRTPTGWAATWRREW